MINKQKIGLGIGIVIVLVVLFFILIYANDKEFEEANPIFEPGQLIQNGTLIGELIFNQSYFYSEKYNIKDLDFFTLPREKSIFRLVLNNSVVEFTSYEGNLYFDKEEFLGARMILIENTLHFFPENTKEIFSSYLPRGSGSVFDFYIGEEEITAYFNEKTYTVPLDSLSYEGEFMVLSFPIDMVENNSVEVYFKTSLDVDEI